MFFGGRHYIVISGDKKLLRLTDTGELSRHYINNITAIRVLPSIMFIFLFFFSSFSSVFFFFFRTCEKQCMLI